MLKKIYLLLTGLLLLNACEDPILIQFLDQNLIFPRAVKIDVPPYSYGFEQDSIIVLGETLFSVDSMCDTLTNKPTLKWETTDAPFVVAAIFDQRPQISENDKNIVNKDRIVWIWHSGLENEQALSEEGWVIFDEGLEVNDIENENFSTNPKPLESNSVYYWGVWAWNSEGVEVNYSSYPLRFFVK